eukprot:s1171_g24.t1
MFWPLLKSKASASPQSTDCGHVAVFAADFRQGFQPHHVASFQWNPLLSSSGDLGLQFREDRHAQSPFFSPSCAKPRHALDLMGHDLDVTNTWPQPLLEELRLGSLPRWAQRELSSTKVPPVVPPVPVRVSTAQSKVGCLQVPLEPLQLVSVSQEDTTSTVTSQVRRLGEDEFREDVLEIVDGGIWKGTALVDAVEHLIGFVVYGVLHGAMSLRYIAIIPEERGKGHGRRLVQHVCQCCLEQKVERLTLFSKRELVSFYKAVGFTEAPEEDGDSEDDLQVPLVMCPLQLGAATGAVPKLLEELDSPSKALVGGYRQA